MEAKTLFIHFSEMSEHPVKFIIHTQDIYCLLDKPINTKFQSLLSIMEETSYLRRNKLDIK